MTFLEEVVINYEVQAHVCSKTASLAEILRQFESSQELAYSSVSLNADASVTLTYIEITCPCCGAVYPYYSKKKISKKQMSTLQNWASPQLSFFNDKSIVMDTDIPQKSLCPNCGLKLETGKVPDTVTINREKTKLLIQTDILDLDTRIRLPYLPDRSFHFPLYEQLELNFRTGKACVRGFTYPNKCLGVLDITNSPRVLESCALGKLFDRSEHLRDAMLRAYETVAGVKAPFSERDITLTDFVFLTRFVGFQKDFYQAVPVDKQTMSISKSFFGIRQLRTPNTALHYLRSLSFAAAPSIIKCVGEHQALLFYLPECETLFQIVKDVNLFRTILRQKEILLVLLLLHQRPGSLKFFSDYCMEFNATRLCRLLCKLPCDSEIFYRCTCYLDHYCSLNLFSQLDERKMWHKVDFISYMQEHQTDSISVPMLSVPLMHGNCAVDGFVFRELTNTAECFSVGAKLWNCLKFWWKIESTIISVSFNRKIVAAIEVNEDIVLQAFAARNNSILAVPGLLEAIKKWSAQNEIQFRWD